jgi:GrpB-like predicted nucleotidyltransferase (UPF0157 family)
MPQRPDPVARALAEPVEVVPYDPAWPARFAEEATHLRTLLPPRLVGRIEHIGSTAVPGLAGKPIIDMILEVPDLACVRPEIAPILEPLGYDLFWRPETPGDPTPAYAWFARRDAAGHRTHDVHLLPPDSPHWDRLAFRDYLRAHPEAARAYGALKTRAAAEHRHDRRAYAAAKSRFIQDALHASKWLQRSKA